MKYIALGFMTMAACFCFYALKAGTPKYRKFIWALYLGIFVFASYLFFSRIITSYYNQQVWDFSAFYLWGKAAVAGYDVYSPENLKIVFNSIKLPPFYLDIFVKEIVDTGFFYPPQSILYFAPLGFLSYYPAYILWMIFNLSFAFASMYLLFRRFEKSDLLSTLVLTATLFFLCSPARLTIMFSQTNFILLFYLLLIEKYANKNVGGIFLALAVVTKPYMLILGVFFLLRKNWGAIIYFMGGMLAITGITFFLFGKSIFLSYILNNPTKRIPPSVFSEEMNQSLHGVLLRAKVISLDHPIVYISVAGGILLLAGLYLLFLLKNKLPHYILPTLLLVGLLIYPATLAYYGVLLLFIIFKFLDKDDQLEIKPYMGAVVIGVVFAVISLSVFACICLLLIILVSKSFLENKIFLKRENS
jgi:hypothetical protein